MSVRNGIALLLAFSALTFLAACGGSSGSVTHPVPPPSGGFSNSNLNGTYVFSVSGTDFNGFALAAVGTFTANGSGGIAGGTLDINDSETGPLPNSAISGSSSYNVQIDGRGTATLKVATPFSTPNLTIDFVLTSSSHGLVVQFDGNGTGSGTIDLQAAGATPTGSYAFMLSGATVSSTPTSWATVGNFTLTGATLAGTDDFNESGLIPFPGQSLTGNFALGPSATPSTTLVTAGFGTLTFDVFAIDATHLKFIETDSTATLSGDAFSQTSTTIPAGTLAFTLNGALTSSGTPFAAGGFVVTNGTNGITGTEDYNDGGTLSPASPPAFTATYTAAGTGRFTLGSFATFVGGTLYAAYPSSGGLLLLEIDSSGITMGAAYTQSSTTFTASQGYGLNLTGVNLGAATGSIEEVDDIAEFTANASGTTAIGVIDENFAPGGSPIFDQALNGTYVAPDANGRGQLSANAGNSSNSTLNGGFALTFYTVDGSTFPFIESDSGQVSAGVFVLQNPSASPSAAASQSHMFIVQPLIRPHSARQTKN